MLNQNHSRHGNRWITSQAHFLGFLMCTLLLGACQQGQHYRSKTGLRYTLYSDGQDSIARLGMTAKVHYVQLAGDSVIDDTYERMPLYYQVMPSYENRYNPLEVFEYGMRRGDSVVTRQIVDTMVSRGILDRIPDWMQPGDEWVTRLKVLDVFSADSLVEADRLLETHRVLKAQRVAGIERIETYLNDQEISPVENNDSLFVQVLKKGSGKKLQRSDVVHLNYSLKTLNGFVLVDTRDTASMGPQEFSLGSGFMPEILETQIAQYPAGSHIRLFLPGVLLFGVQPPASEASIHDDWVVDLEY